MALFGTFVALIWIEQQGYGFNKTIIEHEQRDGEEEANMKKTVACNNGFRKDGNTLHLVGGARQEAEKALENRQPTKERNQECKAEFPWMDGMSTEVAAILVHKHMKGLFIKS